MIDAGVFGEEDVELLGGIIYLIMTESERHQLTVERIVSLLRGSLPDEEWHVRDEKIFKFSDIREFSPPG